MKTELLAPAKNIEIAITAIDAGADAVYIGASGFGARHRAGNSLEDIEKLVNYAHKFYVKVMVTVNTIIKNSELEDVKTLIKKLYEIGVDSIIVQDMAILKWAIEGEIPPIPLHISTQCNNRTEEKVNFFNRLGIPRVVLARELSINQIKNIIEKNPNIEIETFIHGALCVSYSGQCYMSNYLGGRSANRGECAQPCRKKYSVVNEDGKVYIKDKHVLSLKDFNASDKVRDLIKIGVKSFKIEGRLKDKLYVKNVVGYYRQIIDKYSDKTSSGRIDLGFTPNINKTFNRSYTEYFLETRGNCFNFDSPKFIGEKIGKVVDVNKKYFIAKLDKKVVLHNQDGLCFNNTGTIGCFVNKIEGNKIFPNSIDGIEKGMTIYRNIDTDFEKELSNAQTKRQIGVDIKYKNGVLYITDENNNSVSVSVTETEEPNNPDKMNENFIKSMNKTGDSDFYINNLNIESKLPFMPISKINEYRRTLFEHLMKERLKNYPIEKSQNLKYTNYPDNTIDYRGNVFNKDAEEFYKNCGAFVKEYAPEHKIPNNNIELMRTKHCIKYSLNMCKSPETLYLVDDRNEKYRLNFDCKHCEMSILPFRE